MSTSSNLRPKQSGPGGGNPAASSRTATKSSKSTTPFPQNPISGKENPPPGASRPRASSVPKPNPQILPIQRIDKASDVRPRRSTSSAPRGRCPSPSEYMKGSVNKKIDQKGSFGNDKKFVDSKKLGFRGVRNVDGVDLVDKGRDLEKMDKKGSFGKDKKFVDSKKLGFRNSVYSNSVDRIDLGDKGRVLEKGKVRTLEKRVNLLNIDVDSRVKNRVSQSTGLRCGNESIEDEMIYSAGNENVDLVEKDRVFDEARVGEKRVGLLDLEEVRSNDDAYSRVENMVSQSTRLGCGNESIEDEMIYSVGNKNVDLVEKDYVFDEVKVREKSVDLLDLEVVRLNDDVDSRVENRVSHLKGLRPGKDAISSGGVKISERSGGVFREAEMISSVGNVVKLFGRKELVGCKNVGLVEKDCVFEEVNVGENSAMSDELNLKGLRRGKESTLSSDVNLSERSGDICREAEIRYSVENIVELFGGKKLIGNKNVDLVEKGSVFEEVKVRESSKGSSVVGRSNGLKDKAVSEEGKDGITSAKRYPSKLHEKLAFLEGKVKKIALDIKQTKEMLDLNNPDASEVVLFDIQEKISGIEKEMGDVASVGNANAGLVKDGGNDEGEVKETTMQVEGRVGDGKRSVKGLSGQELEARLFPHQKLLEDRACLNSSSEMSQIDETIALEFLELMENEPSAIPVEEKNEDTENSEGAAHENSSSRLIACQNNDDFLLTANEKLEEFDEQENTSRMLIEEDNENSCAYMLRDIGHKISTGGWFVSEGEAVLLAHDDGSCSYNDVTNCEGKAEYKPPAGISPNMWRDCWIVRAPSADGCAGRYVVAASAGNAVEAGFCSWDFYTKHVRAFHVEDGTANGRTALASLPNNTMHRRNAISSTSSLEHQQWFYRPCGPLIVSTASCQRSVKVYDVRDGDHVMRWELQKPVATMEYSSPLQWRNKGKVVVAEAETISLWDVSSLRAQPLLSVSSCNRKISALHVNNTDAELGGGVRQRVSSSEVEGNDGVFCTADSINVLDFRQPSGIGLKIPKLGVDVQSAFSRGDSVLLGCTSLKSTAKKQTSSEIQQFSLRKQRLLSTYVLPDSNAHSHHKAITQVWGNSNLVMGVSGLGLCIYDSSKDEGLSPYTMNSSLTNNVKDVVGSDDLYYPSFDYLASRVLLISRDRPAQCRYMS